MLLKMAIYTVWHEREKLSGAVVGVALGVFLVVFQWGLYFAYKRDTTLVLDAFDADIWIVPKNQSNFDGFTANCLVNVKKHAAPSVKSVHISNRLAEQNPCPLQV